MRLLVRAGWTSLFLEFHVTDLTDRYALILLERHNAAETRGRTVPGRRHTSLGKTAAEHLKAIWEQGNLDEILLSEEVSIKFDLNHRVNSAAMQKSLEKAADELAIAMRLVKLVKDPERYAMIDAGHARKENRIGDLPRDEARQFFKSHFARLLNHDKTGLDDAEKRMLDIRRANISRGEKLYGAMQRQALGLPEKSQKKGRGRA